jgi:hypothetical protein
MLKKTIIAICLISLTEMGWAASGFDYFHTSRFARPIGLGHAYTGIAEGVEATYYNSAGLAFMEGWGIAYSYGNGSQFLIPVTPYDLAICTPDIGGIGHLAFSAHYLIIETDGYLRYVLYRLHNSHRLGDMFSIGGSLNLYQLSYEPGDGRADQNEQAIDLNLSGLYRLQGIFLSEKQDMLKVGIQLTNLFATELPDINSRILLGDIKHPLPQSLSMGISYTWQPNWTAVNGLRALALLASFDLVYDNILENETYKADRRLANIGIELRLLEILALRYGRENEDPLSDIKYTTPQYPVSRFGLGLNLPLHKFFEMNKKLVVLVDYAQGDWQHQHNLDQSINIWAPFSGKNQGSDKNAWSFQVQAEL